MIAPLRRRGRHPPPSMLTSLASVLSHMPMVESTVSKRPSDRSCAPVAFASSAERLRSIPQQLGNTKSDRHIDHCRHAVRLYQIEKLEDRSLAMPSCLLSPQLLRIPYIDYLGSSFHCGSLLFDPRLQFLRRAAQYIMPACLQFAANIGVPTDRGNVRCNSVSQRLRAGLPPKIPASPSISSSG